MILQKHDFSRQLTYLVCPERGFAALGEIRGQRKGNIPWNVMEGGKVWLSLELKFEHVFFLMSDIHEIQESSFSLLFPKKAAVYLEDMSNQNFF